MLLLGVLVLVHEWGHYTVAKLTGMKVQEFAFGFGPILARLFKRGETEFIIHAIPLGGFVRIAGMEPGEEEEGGFNAASAWHRTLVILAGPFMSLVLGYVVFLLIGFVWGFPTGRAAVAKVNRGTPAAIAGLKSGDVIYALDGNKIEGGKLIDAIHGSPGQELTLGVLRDGRRIIIKATPKLSPNPILEDATPKEIEQLKKQPDFREKVGLLGFAPKTELKRAGVVESVVLGTEQTFKVVTEIFKVLFTKRIRSEIGGIVMIGYATSEMVKTGPDAVLLELAALSVMLGVLNLIPWPVLDGGHILLIVIEKIRRKKVRPESWVIVQTIGLATLIFLAIFLVFLDLSRILSNKMPF